MRKLYWIGWAFLALSASMAAGHFRSASISGPAGPEALAIEASAGPGAARALEWFQAMRPHCNAVDVETRHRRSPPPLGWSGAGYSAACYALAGRVDRARFGHRFTHMLIRNRPRRIGTERRMSD